VKLSNGEFRKEVEARQKTCWFNRFLKAERLMHSKPMNLDEKAKHLRRLDKYMDHCLEKKMK
jgi:hypothetical protein